MPYSSEEGKDFVKAYFGGMRDLHYVVDIGPGAGTYFNLLDPHLAVTWWTAIEVWAPYIDQFNLREKYNEIILADAYWVDWDKIGNPDLTILGDVLEHMSLDRASSVLEAAVRSSRYVIVASPIIHYPQGAEMGNHWETHVIHFDSETMHDFLDGYKILAEHEGNVVGTYILKGDIA
jgi:hypothetical protein